MTRELFGKVSTRYRFLRIAERDAAWVYHVAGSERMSRYDFEIKITEVFRLDRSLTAPIKMKDLRIWLAKGPRDSSPSVNRAKHELKVRFLDIREGLHMMQRAYTDQA